MLTPNRPCPVCGSTDNQILFKQSFSVFENNLLDGYNVVSCNNCGFCFSDNIPDQDSFDVYYREMSKYEKPDNNSRESQYDINRFSQTVEFLKQNIKSKDSYIVEIGCASGLLLSQLKQQGFKNLLGIDPSPACVETVKTRYAIDSMTGTISDLSSIQPDSVELLVLVGVLEHIRELNIALHELRKVLKPDGKICIVVPDASQYFNGKDAPFQEFSVEHINFFGPGSLSNLMAKNDFFRLVIEQQVFEVNYNTLTPVILSIYVKTNKEDKPFIFDKETLDNLKEYISKCHHEEKSIQNKISKIYKQQDPIIIWGTGAQTLHLLENSDLGKANITAFVDSNPKYQGNSLNNIRVIAPEELKEKRETILISTRAYQNEIESQIREKLKLPNRIIKLF